MTDFYPGTNIPEQNLIALAYQTYHNYEVEGLVSACKDLCESKGRIVSIGHTVYENGSVVISCRLGEITVWVNDIKVLSSQDKLALPFVKAA